jgi:hypothetical protein
MHHHHLIAEMKSPALVCSQNPGKGHQVPHHLTFLNH